jgi:hypothetical protein
MLLFSAFKQSCNVIDIFEGQFQMLNAMEIRPVGVTLLHTDGQTDMTRLTAATCFAIEPKNDM